MSTAPPTSSTHEPLEVYYTCRKCAYKLFSRTQVLHEAVPGNPTNDTSVTTVKAGWRHTRSGHRNLGGACTSVFIQEPPPWIHDIHSNNGRILCPRCDAKLGSFAWSGAPCSCGEWVTPAFQFQLARIDQKGIVQVPFVAAGKMENGVSAV